VMPRFQASLFGRCNAASLCGPFPLRRSNSAMEAGLTDHVWSLEEICALLPKPTVKPSIVEKDLIRKARR
jgi:hypothetical protein